MEKEVEFMQKPIKNQKKAIQTKTKNQVLTKFSLDLYKHV